MKKTLLAIEIVALITFPVIGFAQAQDLGSVVGGIVTVIVGYLRTILFGLGTLVIIIAGYYYLSAGGNAEKVSTAHKLLIWGLIGILVAALAETIANGICSVATTFGGTCQ